jgi:hypothetical protein
MRTFYLFLIFFLSFSISYSADFTSCEVLNSNSNTLSDNVTVVGDCFLINQSDVSLDCNGYTITGDGTGRGFQNNGLAVNNFTLSNCIVKNFQNGIYDWTDFDWVTVINTTFMDMSSNAISLFTGGEIFNSTFINNSQFAARILGSVLIDNSYFEGNGFGTYYISILKNNSLIPILNENFNTQYELKNLNFEYNETNITLNFIQKNRDFGAIEYLSISTCGSTYSPILAYNNHTGDDVLGDVLYDDLDVVDAHEKNIIVTWELPLICNTNLTLNMKANEHYPGRPLYHPKSNYVSYEGENKTFDIEIDGEIFEVDNIKIPSYTYLMKPTTGHPESDVFIYNYYDEENMYFLIDITADNTNELNEDWIKLILYENNSEIEYLINDTFMDFGKCAFNRTSKVLYKHQTCEFKVPLVNNLSDLGYRIEYYGTGGGGCYGALYIGNPPSTSVVIRNSIFQRNNCAIEISDMDNTSIYNNLFNSSNQNIYVTSATTTSEWNTTQIVGNNIYNGATIGGNFWANYAGTDFSQTCVDLDNNSICDSSFTIYGPTSNIDYLPLSTYTPEVTLSSNSVSSLFPNLGIAALIITSVLLSFFFI